MSTRMSAAVVTAYGSPDVVKIVQVKKPTPKAGEVLVKVHFTTVTSGDARIRAARFPAGFMIPARLALGITAPRKKILGWEFSGTVEEIGAEVSHFQVGDEVMGYGMFGAHAEYLCIHENHGLVKKPQNISLQEAAAIPFGGSTALYFLHKARVQKGERVLVNGASGAVGLMTVQIAHSMGARVTGVCSTKNASLVKSLGAQNVIDYTKREVLQDDQSYDVIFDTVGNLSFSDTQKFLNPSGRHVALVADLPVIFTSGKKANGKELVTGTAPDTKEQLVQLSTLIRSGKLKAVVGKVFPFKNIAKAHEYVDSGHKVGAAVVSLQNKK